MRDHRDAVFVRAIGHQRHLLIPAAVLAAGLQPEFLEPVGDVLRRSVVTGLAGHTAFAGVVGKPRDMPLERLAGYDAFHFRLRCFGCRRLAAGSDGKCRSENHCFTHHRFCPCTAR